MAVTCVNSSPLISRDLTAINLNAVLKGQSVREDEMAKYGICPPRKSKAFRIDLFHWDTRIELLVQRVLTETRSRANLGGTNWGLQMKQVMA